MNQNRLLLAQDQFLSRYPTGFEHPELVELGKKHKMDKHIEFAQSSFSIEAFSDKKTVLDNWIKLVSRSSMVSVFEKPKFKDLIKGLSPLDEDLILEALKDQLHGNEQRGFELLLEILTRHKMAKWTIMTCVLIYFRPNQEVFVKPTTAKGVINTFELQDLVYKAKPSWAFYKAYRDELMDIKKLLDNSLSPNNAALSGFLMMNIN